MLSGSSVFGDRSTEGASSVILKACSSFIRFSCSCFVPADSTPSKSRKAVRPPVCRDRTERGREASQPPTLLKPSHIRNRRTIPQLQAHLLRRRKSQRRQRFPPRMYPPPPLKYPFTPCARLALWSKHEYLVRVGYRDRHVGSRRRLRHRGVRVWVR